MRSDRPCSSPGPSQVARGHVATHRQRSLDARARPCLSFAAPCPAASLRRLSHVPPSPFAPCSRSLSRCLSCSCAQCRRSVPPDSFCLFLSRALSLHLSLSLARARTLSLSLFLSLALALARAFNLSLFLSRSLCLRALLRARLQSCARRPNHHNHWRRARPPSLPTPQKSSRRCSRRSSATQQG